MLKSDVTIPVAVLAMIRGDVSARCLADRFGVTEALVNEWKDVFVVAGVLALREHGRPVADRHISRDGGLSGATTNPCPLSGATTTPQPTTTPHPTTTPEVTKNPPTSTAGGNRRRRSSKKR